MRRATRAIRRGDGESKGRDNPQRRRFNRATRALVSGPPGVGEAERLQLEALQRRRGHRLARRGIRRTARVVPGRGGTAPQRARRAPAFI